MKIHSPDETCVRNGCGSEIIDTVQIQTGIKVGRRTSSTNYEKRKN
jgi:hypothetical protein